MKFPSKRYIRNIGLARGFLPFAFVFMLVSSGLFGREPVIPEPVKYYLGYSGNNLWNPGMSAGFGYSICELERSRSLELSSRIGFYLDPGSHFGTYLAGGIKYEATGSRGVFRTVIFEPLGIYRSFLGETYSFNDGDPQRVILAGSTSYAPSAGIGIGKRMDNAAIRGWYTRLNISVIIPYNTFVMPLFTVDGGIILGRKGGKG